MEAPSFYEDCMFWAHIYRGKRQEVGRYEREGQG